ncbi:hypothetical protein C5167_017833 [Papaver somniferum]|uniref:Rapid alkalinization factor 1 n=1 Tax=Papaver somniferum TaxID=3469 RepID=A0A4Y7IPM0_PAPSO|nr:rapid alkalinization factor-like [Papaver somniferum]RZC49415.1 hypothetical protein C5167_017833 [Papaver somniferum]
MGKGMSILLVICAVVFLMVISSNVEAFGEHNLDWMPSSFGEGTIGESLEIEEFQMDSEISRRILATTKYISYGALRRNTVPCSRRGASYYNCKPGAQANPYSRGCSKLSRCRS